MLIVRDVLLSDDIVEKQFHCNLDACKGACCWKGDYGAPVTEKEEKSITKDLSAIKAFLNEKSQQLLEEEETFKDYSKDSFRGTNLHNDGACVFMVTDDKGYAHCGIEIAHRANKSSLKKPISCHLYPIRVSKEEPYIFESWNYDTWDICSAACDKGKENNIAVYEFCKEAIIRAKDESFYEELDAAVKHMRNEK